ncbi:hypothetical protein WA026_004094 [Henosepilachna vigintioctopunctata]|uniref:Uncharacterized protein n=1 Tax=Henosepilachna vigintioctopunctata TaxID=420089 RepID=A0AAW1UGH9_9CUCU
MPKTRRKKKGKSNLAVRKKMSLTTQNDFEVIDKPRTDYDHDSLNQSNPITSISNLLHTPSPEKSFVLEAPIREECSLETTPKKSRGNLSQRLSHRLGISSRDSLFYQSRICAVPVIFNVNNLDEELRTTDQNRSNSNDSKIYHYSKKEVNCLEHEKPMEDNGVGSIFDTPKSKFEPLYNDKSSNLHNEDNSHPKNVGLKKSLSRSKSENEILNLRGAVNINPYVNYGNLQIKNIKENTVNELSFFTPELLKSKPASTPISRCLETNISRRPLTDINVNSLNIKKKKSQKNSLIHHPSLTPFLDKLKQSDIQSTRKNFEKSPPICKILSITAPVGKVKSPKRIVHYTKSPVNLHKNYTFYKSLIQESRSSSKDDTLGAVRKLFKKLQKYGTATAKWTMSLFSICTRLGRNLKLSISTLCTSCDSNQNQNKTCVCNQYQDEMGKLNTKINELGMNLVDLKSHLIESIQNDKKIENLTSTLEKMSKDVEMLKLLEEEMKSLRLQISNFNTPISATLTRPFVSGAPPPPPPPLPPPPPPSVAHLHSNKLAGPSTKTASTNKPKNVTPRPSISLEDILKVKLKKTSERQTPSRRINTIQPEISLEMLKQVKLRKSLSKPLTPSSLPEISSEGSTSPHSSLKRLLKDDSSFKIKRLRRVGGYSFDDIHKKNLSRFNRERD